MEQLTPPERAAFVLREAFEMPCADIAEIVGGTAAGSRRLHHRAATRLAAARGERFRPTDEDHAELLTRFVEAARGGDLDALAGLLSEDVVAWNDGGGRVRAALNPVVGREHVIAFVVGLAQRFSIGGVRLTEANGRPALWPTVDAFDQIVLLDTKDGAIHGLFAVLDPDKPARFADRSEAADA